VKRADFSNVRDPENRSRKLCVCGAHSTGARKKMKPWRSRKDRRVKEGELRGSQH
jgi:hypothetical protein